MPGRPPRPARPRRRHEEAHHRARLGRALDHRVPHAQCGGGHQQRAADGAPLVSHSAFEPHLIQGWTTDFIPYVLQEAIDSALYDEVMPVAGEEGIRWAKALAREEGILTGISGGSTFAVARRIADSAPPGSVILCMLPDTGERYLTTPLFEGIEEEMTDEERSLSRSTPSAQFPG